MLSDAKAVICQIVDCFFLESWLEYCLYCNDSRCEKSFMVRVCHLRGKRCVMLTHECSCCFNHHVMKYLVEHPALLEIL